jgi:hypothetical protein
MVSAGAKVGSRSVGCSTLWLYGGTGALDPGNDPGNDHDRSASAVAVGDLHVHSLNVRIRPYRFATSIFSLRWLRPAQDQRTKAQTFHALTSVAFRGPCR